MTCAELEALAAELALGTVSGAERAVAIEHLAGCPACRDLVDQLARVADSMLSLAPAMEPPPGFESKVLARMGVAAAAPVVPLAPARHRRPGRRMLVGVAAAALVAAMAGAGVTALVDEGGRHPVVSAAVTAGVRTALAVDPDGRWTCRAVVYGDRPTWLVVSLDRADTLTATFTVEAFPGDSPDPVHLGTFATDQGHGTFAQAVPMPAQDMRSVRVLDAGGRVRYEMTFPST